ncbi:MAG: c-type cytochrome [Hyphomicrobiaceae bacterium]|nr:c-type cytochrome [Hyphomicrobiaceae bacterium]
MLKWALAVGAVLVLPAVASAQDAAKGKAVFNTSCKACHDAGEGGGKVGPGLKGIVGVKAGTHHPEYAYSAAMKGAGLTWDEATLDKYLADWAKKLVPGTLMNFPGVKDEAKRKDLIAYLKSTGG